MNRTPRSNCSEYEMYSYVYNNLKRRFPKHKGWNVYKQPYRRTYIPDFLVERRNASGVIERIPVEVKNECYIHNGHLKQLTDYMRRLAGRNVNIIMGILVVPSKSELSDTLRDRVGRHNIKIIRLRKCKCI
ncbi:MAG: hypothetical protein F7C08_03015 [Desulfurococcales archaeon]|nr:hypothetical protein [Desulfurococcales archaeon]